MISFAFAQAGSISGVVVDSNGSFPLGGANVFLEGTFSLSFQILF